MSTVTATTALPFENLSRATAGLRAQLRYELLDQGPALDWSTFEVIGPVESRDARGRVWFEYTATVESR